MNAVRFWAKVADMESDGCWEWRGARNQDGYGVVGWKENGGTRTTTASRIAVELTTGEPIPAGLLVCHECDNPPCCNPNHLFLGTYTDNVRDAMRKGRHHGCRKMAGNDRVNVKRGAA
jgi:hypothetical protein